MTAGRARQSLNFTDSCSEPKKETSCPVRAAESEGRCLNDRKIYCPVCLYSSLTKSAYAGEDLIGCLSPGKGLGLVVVALNIGPNGLFQFARAAMGATPDLLFGETRKPGLYQVDPRCAGGSIVQMETRPLGEPEMN